MRSLLLLPLIISSMLVFSVFGIEKVEELSNSDLNKVNVVTTTSGDLLEVEGQCTCDCCNQDDLKRKLNDVIYKCIQFRLILVSCYQLCLCASPLHISCNLRRDSYHLKESIQINTKGCLKYLKIIEILHTRERKIHVEIMKVFRATSSYFLQV